MNTVIITISAITETEHGTEVDLSINGFVSIFKMKLGHTLTLSFPPPVAKLIANGCRKKLAPDQYWTFCGETDMGSLPVLCTECGGELRLE